MPPRQRTSPETQSPSVARSEAESGYVPAPRDASDSGLSELAQGLIEGIIAASYPRELSGRRLFSQLARLSPRVFAIVEGARSARLQELGHGAYAPSAARQEEKPPTIPPQPRPWSPSGVLETMSPAKGPDPRMAQLPPRDRE